jgi:hypothetical protein
VGERVGRPRLCRAGEGQPQRIGRRSESGGSQHWAEEKGGGELRTCWAAVSGQRRGGDAGEGSPSGRENVGERLVWAVSYNLKVTTQTPHEAHDNKCMAGVGGGKRRASVGTLRTPSSGLTAALRAGAALMALRWRGSDGTNVLQLTWTLTWGLTWARTWVPTGSLTWSLTGALT